VGRVLPEAGCPKADGLDDRRLGRCYVGFLTDPLAAHTHLTAKEAARAEAFFERFFTFDFYDGPETGIAETADRAAYRFEAIGESRHRRYRAYLLVHLTGDIPFPTKGREAGFITAAEWEAAFDVPSGERYVVVSDLWLRCFVADRLGGNTSPPTRFAEAHRLLRSKFVSAD
jgi:hypothetical protein